MNKRTKGGFLGLFLGNLGANLLVNMLAGSRKRSCKSWLWKQKRKGMLRAGYGNKMDF